MHPTRLGRIGFPERRPGYDHGVHLDRDDSSEHRLRPGIGSGQHSGCRGHAWRPGGHHPGHRHWRQSVSLVRRGEADGEKRNHKGIVLSAPAPALYGLSRLPPGPNPGRSPQRQHHRQFPGAWQCRHPNGHSGGKAAERGKFRQGFPSAVPADCAEYRLHPVFAHQCGRRPQCPGLRRAL